MTIAVQNHILIGYIHGGYDDAASVTLWIDEPAGVAHLTGHSGSMVPLKGPVAPDAAPVFVANGRKGYVADFNQESVETQVSLLQEALSTWEPGKADSEANSKARAAIEDILEGFNLSEMSYADWLASEDRSTRSELYG